MSRISILLPFVITLTLASCDKIYTGEELNSEETEHIKELGLLDSGDKIYQFYSNNNGVKGAGNFYTTKRIAHYWSYQRDKEYEFAYYKDIARIIADSRTVQPLSTGGRRRVYESVLA